MPDNRLQKWLEDVVSFKDDIDTLFIKGPFEVDGGVYDYKLIDRHGEDYCTKEQMLSWDVRMVKKLS
jgi:hypothetical protein